MGKDMLQSPLSSYTEVLDNKERKIDHTSHIIVWKNSRL